MAYIDPSRMTGAQLSEANTALDLGNIRFLDSLNPTQAERDRFYGEGQNFWGLYGVNDLARQTVLSDIVAGRTPDEFITALESVAPQAKDFLGDVRGNEALKTSLHGLASTNPEFLSAMKWYIQGVDYEMNEFMATVDDPALKEALTAMTASGNDHELSELDAPVEVRQTNAIESFNGFLMRSLTGDDENAINFATHLGATEEELQKLNYAIDQSLYTFPANPAYIEQAFTDIIATKTPDQLLTAFEKTDPSTKVFVDGVREYPELVDAIHNAASNDPTVLRGLQTLVGGNSSVGGGQLLEALQDDTNRKILVDVLNKTGDQQNLDFADAAEYFDSAMAVNADQSKENRERYRMALARFGIEDTRLAAGDMFDNLLARFSEDPMGALMDILKDPAGFLNEIVLAFSGGESQFAAGQAWSEGIGQYVGLFTQNQEMNDFVSYYGPKAVQHFADLSGQTDEQNGTQWTAENKPQTVEEAQRLIEPDVEKIKQFENGNTNIAGAIGTGLNTEGGETLKLSSTSFNLEALGIRPWVTQAETQQVADYDAQTEMLRRHQNNMGLGAPSLVG